MLHYNQNQTKTKIEHGEYMRDRHHILNTAKQYNAQMESKALRDTPSLIPRIERETHNNIHAGCPAVPLMGYHMLRRVLNDFHPQRDTLESIDDLVMTIDRAGNHYKTHEIERGVGELAIRAIELQRPFLVEEFNRPTIIDLGATKKPVFVPVFSSI